MEAWSEVEKIKDKEMYRTFQRKLAFNPSTERAKWPSIKEPQQSITYSMEPLWTVGNEERDQLHSNLLVQTHRALKRCLKPDQPLYAYDYQHASYWFYPHVLTDEQNPTSWKVPLWPNGEYSIFVVESGNIGLFVHPWERSFCIFGEPLLKAFEINSPKLFKKPMRKGN